MDYDQYWNDIYQKSEELNNLLISYWQEYSFLDDWQFWVAVFLIVFPLFVLYITVDRKRIFEMLFFGFSIHVLWTYVDTLLGSTTLFVHNYFLIPLLPFALSLNTSVLPVTFLLVYQYCTNHNKNFYLYSIIFSAILAFLFASLEEIMGLVEFNRGMNQFYVFLIDIAITFVSYWLTRFILKLRQGHGEEHLIP